MRTDPKTFGRILASRICHDLISPIGAINNGLELMQLSAPDLSAAASEEVALISQSAASASDALKFIRIAFGEPGELDQLSGAEIEGATTAFLGQARRSVEWRSPPPDMMRSEAQMLYLAGMVAAEHIPIGGELVFDHIASAPFTLSIVLAGSRIARPERPEAVTPRHAHAGLLDQLLTAHGAALTVEIDETRANLRIAPL